MRDSGATYNTLYMKISTTAHTLTAEFVETLADEVARDHCTMDFSGRSDYAVALKLYCPALKNKPRMSARERKPLPVLNYTMALLARELCIVEDYEYLGEYKRPLFDWYGTYENTNSEMERYFKNRDHPDGGNKVLNASKGGAVRGKYVEFMAPWGLDRIDMRFGMLSNDYIYDNLGENVDIYIIDTGIRVSHNEFQGRATFLVNGVGDGVNTDCIGHGTHVASLAAGMTYGVAKGALLWAAKALGCDGTGDTATIAAAIMGVIEHANGRTPGRRAVASLSLGGDYSLALNNAVLSLTSAGITTVVAAGNDYADACSFSPSSLGNSPGVLSVAASTISDTRPPFSNYGGCVSISAPGVDIIGAYATSDSTTAVLSGTSMATPFVTGVVALLLNQNLLLTPAEVDATVLAWETPAIITGTSLAGGGSNLVYSRIDVTQSPPNVDPPATVPTSPPVTPGLPPLVPSDASRTTVVSLLSLAWAAFALYCIA